MGFAVVAVATGCAKLDLPPEQGTLCSSSLVLDGSQPTAPTEFDVDLGSTDICMQLDASRNIVQAHFQLSIDAPGITSTLVDLDNVPLREGWDVQVGTHTSHDLEWSLDAGEIRDVVLHVSRTGTHASALLRVSLYEPFE